MAKEPGTAVAPSKGDQLPADFLEEALASTGAGVSSNPDDNVLPFIRLLQDLSPETKVREKEKYVEGAEPGMYYNNATRQLYAADAEMAERTGRPLLDFQPCAFERAIVQWVPRNDGGGFVARHSLQGGVEETMNKLGGKQIVDPQDPNKKIWRTGDGKHDLIDTRYFYGNVVTEDGDLFPAVIGFASTGHTPARQWMTMMRDSKVKNPQTGVSQTMDSFMKKYRVGAVTRKNNKGTFFVPRIDDLGIITSKPIRDAGRVLYKLFEAGMVKAEAESEMAPSGDDAPI